MRDLDIEEIYEEIKGYIKAHDIKSISELLFEHEEKFYKWDASKTHAKFVMDFIDKKLLALHAKRRPARGTANLRCVSDYWLNEDEFKKFQSKLLNSFKRPGKVNSFLRGKWSRIYKKYPKVKVGCRSKADLDKKIKLANDKRFAALDLLEKLYSERSYFSPRDLTIAPILANKSALKLCASHIKRTSRDAAQDLLELVKFRDNPKRYFKVIEKNYPAYEELLRILDIIKNEDSHSHLLLELINKRFHIANDVDEDIKSGKFKSALDLKIDTKKGFPFYKSLFFASDSAQSLNINSMKDYKERYKEDPRLPSAPDGFYKSAWTNWKIFLETENKR